MRTHWDLQLAARGDGLWYVGIDDDGVRVIAPPGVHITGARFQTTDRPLVAGWRLARWDMDEENPPLVDIDPPSDPPREITTCDVLSLVGDASALEVRAMLTSRLLDAAGFGEPGPRAECGPPEELAQAGARSVEWLLGELREAFPDEEWHAPQRGVPVMEQADALLCSLLGREDPEARADEGALDAASADREGDIEIACDAVCAWPVDPTPARRAVQRSRASPPRTASIPPPRSVPPPRRIEPDPPPIEAAAPVARWLRALLRRRARGELA